MVLFYIHQKYDIHIRQNLVSIRASTKQIETLCSAKNITIL